ncbi:hypothetical protein [Kitasatospora sp. NPDC001095]
MTDPVLGRRALGRGLPARRHLLARTDPAPAALVHHLGGLRAQAVPRPPSVLPFAPPRRADRRAAEAEAERVPAFAGAGGGGSVRFGESG